MDEFAEIIQKHCQEIDKRMEMKLDEMLKKMKLEILKDKGYEVYYTCTMPNDIQNICNGYVPGSKEFVSCYSHGDMLIENIHKKNLKSLHVFVCPYHRNIIQSHLDYTTEYVTYFPLYNVWCYGVLIET